MRMRVLAWLVILQVMTPVSVFAYTLDGRLFTTPAERVRMDQLRSSSKSAPTVEAVEDDKDEAVISPRLLVPSSVSVQGYITRSDGRKGTVWVNNVPLRENEEVGPLQVKRLHKDGKQVEISIPSIGRDLKLKAGQVYMPESDVIAEDKARVHEQEN